MNSSGVDANNVANQLGSVGSVDPSSVDSDSISKAASDMWRDVAKASQYFTDSVIQSYEDNVPDDLPEPDPKGLFPIGVSAMIMKEENLCHTAHCRLQVANSTGGDYAFAVDRNGFHWKCVNRLQIQGDPGHHENWACIPLACYNEEGNLASGFKFDEDCMDMFVFANGCFWGSEKGVWRLPGGGIYATAVGYAGGFTPNPTYEEACSGLTGHTEAVQVVFDPEKISLVDILRWFWEAHDPTQGMGQGNDRGTQYRSGLYFFNDEQRRIFEASKAAYDKALQGVNRGRGPITTEIVAAADFPDNQVFYYAEDYHQQYLAKPRARPYCSAQPQVVALPDFESWCPEDLQEKYKPKLTEEFWQQHGPTPHCVIMAPNEPILFP